MRMLSLVPPHGFLVRLDSQDAEDLSKSSAKSAVVATSQGSFFSCSLVRYCLWVRRCAECISGWYR